MKSSLHQNLPHFQDWIDIRLKRLWWGGGVHLRAIINHSRLGLQFIACRLPRSYELTPLEQKYCTYQHLFKKEQLAFFTIPCDSSWWLTKSPRHLVFSFYHEKRLLNLNQLNFKRQETRWTAPPDFLASSRPLCRDLEYTNEKLAFYPADLQILDHLRYGINYASFAAETPNLSHQTLSQRKKYLEKEQFFLTVPVFFGLNTPLKYYILATSSESIHILQTLVGNCPIANIYHGTQELTSTPTPFVVAFVRIPFEWRESFEKVLRRLSSDRKLARTIQYSRVQNYNSKVHIPQLVTLWDSHKQCWFSEDT